MVSARDPLPARRMALGVGSVDIASGGRARPMGFQCKARRATPLGWMPSKESQRRNGGPVARALRVASKRPRYGVALLAKGMAIGGVARLVAEPFGHNAIPRRDCQQTLGPAAFPGQLRRVC